MRKILFLLFIGFAICFTSCRKDFVFEPSKGGLTFSKDTVYLDTVFSNIGSSTYRLKVYNKSNTDISIPKIQLQKGVNSKYRLLVDGMTGDVGMQGKSFSNVELLAKDSLFVFIEVTSDVAAANPTDFLYTDKIEFTNVGNPAQVVDLVTLIQDAYFLYPKRFADGMTETLPIGDEEIYGFVLDENDPVNGNEYIWNNTKPYVIYGYAAVPGGKTLTVEKGARIHFHDQSGLIVGQNGTLKVEGEKSNTEALENQVVFEGDRLEPNFAETPGQWGAIWLTSGSTNHTIDHLTIKNAIIGLLIENNAGSAMSIKNTQIYNSSNVGIFGKTANIIGENIVVNYGGQASVACTLGGSYDFKHCTFNNNWPSSKQVALLIDNYFADENNQQTSFPLAKAEFTNCIIFGSNQKELAINKSADNLNWTTPIFTKCQIKYNAIIANNSVYSFLNDASNIIKNGNPDFENVTENDLRLKENSDAINFGNNIGIPLDILGNPRNGIPDLGAYEFQP
jgi:hypothetical protein